MRSHTRRKIVVPRAHCDAIKGPIRIGSSEMRISAEDEDYTRKCCADDEVGEVEGEGMSSEICAFLVVSL